MHPNHPASAGSPFVPDESLGSGLGPQLVAQSRGRLSNLAWFRSTWQHGGASTGLGTWTEGGRSIEVFVKFPVSPLEHRWTTRLGLTPLGEWDEPRATNLPTPRVVAADVRLGSHDLAYLVTERLFGPALRERWTREALEGLIAAAVDAQAAMTRHIEGQEAKARPARVTWESELAKAREICRASSAKDADGPLPEAQRWNEALKRLSRSISRLADVWESRPITGWCHGDVHPGNAMHRSPQPGGDGRTVLIDLALVHPGHWVEDAVYLERQFWTHPEQLFGIHVVGAMAKRRRDLGLEADIASGDYGMLANLRRALMAATAPAHLSRIISQRYLHVALETLERLLPQLPH
jgi:Phosphotransferase enzyme family